RTARSGSRIASRRSSRQCEGAAPEAPPSLRARRLAGQGAHGRGRLLAPAARGAARQRAAAGRGVLRGAEWRVQRAGRLLFLQPQSARAQATGSIHSCAAPPTAPRPSSGTRRSSADRYIFGGGAGGCLTRVGASTEVHDCQCLPSQEWSAGSSYIVGGGQQHHQGPIGEMECAPNGRYDKCSPTTAHEFCVVETGAPS
ncbi:unnamed protein product, partial [Prorocentrum cordatum]